MVDQTVVNASPIILLSGQADWSSFGQWRGVVWIPNPVVTEVEAKGSTDPAAQALSAASWARRVEAGDIPAAIAAWNLGAGESAVLAVARAMPGAHAILDDREARRCAAAPSVSRCSGRSALCFAGNGLGRFPRCRRSWSVSLPSGCT